MERVVVETGGAFFEVVNGSQVFLELPNGKACCVDWEELDSDVLADVEVLQNKLKRRYDELYRLIMKRHPPST